MKRKKLNGDGWGFHLSVSRVFLNIRMRVHIIERYIIV